MNTFEIFPVLSGLLLGSIMGYVRPALRKRVAMISSVLFGVAATLASGEYQVAWTFLFIDVGLVGTVAVVAFLLADWLRLNSVRLGEARLK